jgi:hypothetical protein
MEKRYSQKDSSSLLYIFVGIALTIGAIYALQHFEGRNRDITIHVPKVEVR